MEHFIQILTVLQIWRLEDAIAKYAYQQRALPRYISETESRLVVSWPVNGVVIGVWALIHNSPLQPTKCSNPRPPPPFTSIDRGALHHPTRCVDHSLHCTENCTAFCLLPPMHCGNSLRRWVTIHDGRHCCLQRSQYS